MKTIRSRAEWDRRSKFYYVDPRLNSSILKEIFYEKSALLLFSAVGCLKDGELHVTPLKGILQLRPSFVFLDRGDSKQESTGAGGDDSQDEEEEAKPITVR